MLVIIEEGKVTEYIVSMGRYGDEAKYLLRYEELPLAIHVMLELYRIIKEESN